MKENDRKPAKYTDEYKRNAVIYYRQTGKTQKECADDLGIPQKTLEKWIGAARATDPKGSAEADELRNLKEENARLKEENALLREFAAFYLPSSGR